MTNSLTLYYVTTPENADAILRHGFKGEVILKDQIHNGDWSKDRAIVEISFACDISQFVEPNSAIGYRTWRIPATFINSHAKSRPIHGRLLVSPKFKHYVERLSDLTPDRIAKIAEIVDPAIIEKMMDCLQRMRPRHRSRSDNEKERVRRSPMDRGRAKQIVERALAITWKWIGEDQYRDASRFRCGDTRKHARDASDLIFQLNAELELAAPRNSALNEMLERPAKTSDFDREMLEDWLLDIVELTGTEFEKLPEAYNFIETSEVCCLHHWQADDRRIGEEPDHGAIIGAIRTKCTTPRCKLLLWVKLPGGWILTRSATPSIALLHGQIHRQKSVPVSNPQLPPDFEGKQSAWQEGISSRFNEVGRCTSRQNSGGARRETSCWRGTRCTRSCGAKWNDGSEANQPEAFALH